MERYRAATERLGHRIDAAVSPAFESLGRSKIVVGTAKALDRFASSFERPSATSASRPVREQKTSGPAIPVVSIAESKCTNGVLINDETTTLKPIARLRLRSAPSMHAATIRILEPGTIVTARRVSCGNWTEIVQNRKPIGFVFSAFLTTP